MSATIIYSSMLVIGIGMLIFKTISIYRNELKTDKQELKNQSIEDKFSYIIEGLNEYCYKGLGKITKINKQALSLYKEGSCQIVSFQYSLGVLTIIWKFKYYQQEMIYEKNFDARNSPEEWQLNTLKTVILQFIEQYKVHEKNVDASGIPMQKLSEFGISKENMKKSKDFLNNI